MVDGQEPPLERLRRSARPRLRVRRKDLTNRKAPFNGPRASFFGPVRLVSSAVQMRSRRRPAASERTLSRNGRGRRKEESTAGGGSETDLQKIGLRDLLALRWLSLGAQDSSSQSLLLWNAAEPCTGICAERSCVATCKLAKVSFFPAPASSRPLPRRSIQSARRCPSEGSFKVTCVSALDLPSHQLQPRVHAALHSVALARSIDTLAVSPGPTISPGVSHFV